MPQHRNNEQKINNWWVYTCNLIKSNDVNDGHIVFDIKQDTKTVIYYFLYHQIPKFFNTKWWIHYIYYCVLYYERTHTTIGMLELHQYISSKYNKEILSIAEKYIS